LDHLAHIWEKRGELANFDAKMLAALADILEVTADRLLEPTKSKRGKRG
jgi:hypothetical protein